MAYNYSYWQWLFGGGGYWVTIPATICSEFCLDGPNNIYANVGGRKLARKLLDTDVGNDADGERNAERRAEIDKAVASLKATYD